MDVIKISSGDLVQELAGRVAALGYERVAVLAVVGAVDSFSLTNMKADDPTTDETTEFGMPSEISGVGEITKGWVNIHVTVGVQGGTAYCGHLASAKIETHFVRVFVEPFAAPKRRSVVPILRSNPTIRRQWQLRLETFKRGDTTTSWETYR